jgi:hypothetical protein
MSTSKTTRGPHAMPCLVSTSEATCLLSIDTVSVLRLRREEGLGSPGEQDQHQGLA